MMKNVFLVSLLSLVAGAMAGCQNMKFTFNLKPKYPPGLADDYGVGDDDNAKIEALLKDVPNKMGEMGYENIAISNLKTGSSCDQYDCNNHPGDKCLPYCFAITFCIGPDLEARGVTVVSADDLAKIQQIEIDRFRKSLPESLGIKNQFMMDVYFSFA